MKVRSASLRIAFAALIAFVLCTVTAPAEDEEKFEGTQKAELEKLQLPKPSGVKVAVLPFWDFKSEQRHIDDTTSYTQELFGRHGFVLIGKEAVLSAVKADKEIEPGQPFRRSDAARFGQVLGADWVVYGEVYELETYVKTSFFTARKKAKISLKVTVVNVATGEILYWHKRSDTSGGTGFANLRHASTIEAKACRVCLDRAYKLLLDSLPAHTVKPEEDKPEQKEEEPKAARN